jgi:hypothetical protein
MALYTDALRRLLGRDTQNAAEILNVLDERGNMRLWPAAGHENIQWQISRPGRESNRIPSEYKITHYV